MPQTPLVPFEQNTDGILYNSTTSVIHATVRNQSTNPPALRTCGGDGAQGSSFREVQFDQPGVPAPDDLKGPSKV